MQSRAAHLFSDGEAAYASGDTFNWPIAKISPVPHLNLIVCARGSALGSALAPQAIAANGRSFDEAREKAPETLRRLLHELSASPVGAFEMYVAGWASNGPAAWMIQNTESHGLPAFSAVDIDGSAFVPGEPDLIGQIVAGLPPHYKNLDDLDIEHEASRIAEVWRNSPGDLRPGKFITLATVSETKITQRIIKRWDQ
ncbi:MAG TPA: hypothetical protein VH206_14305 [Xanthobacteraceae bacterium]|nr:hypothetical protein [Xanthobacteraceae bacterium]